MLSSGFSRLLSVRHAFSRRQWRSLLQFGSLVSLCLAVIIGCTNNAPPTADSAPTEATATASGRITMGTTLTARTLDPADAYEIFPGILLHNMGDQLYSYEPGTTDLKPQLATALPTISDDGLTYTIPLRDDVTFHDGSAFNAEI
ncbi:MAG TPA: ABC transporter substrate-binding protein, partial [Candidatus Obscuribacterales bacterium]